MKRRFSVVLLLLAALVAVAATAQAQDNAKLIGSWEIVLETPQGTRNIPLIIKEENGKLVASQPFNSAEIKGNDVTLKMTVKFQDNDLPITYTGKVEGDEMKGDADFGGFASGGWTAKRKAAAGAAAPAAPAAATAGGSAVAGDWDLTIESPQGQRTIGLSLKDEGGKLSGKIKSPQGEAPLDSVTLAGSDITFKMTREVQGQQMVFTYTGKVESGKMKGDVDFGGFASGTWQAVKK